MERLTSIINSGKNFKEIVESGKLWTDPGFPHDDSATKGIKASFQWERASQIFEDNEKIYKSFSGDDIELGALDDGYLLSAISALAESPGRLQKLFMQEKNPAGCYPVTLYPSGRRADVIVDDYFPINSDNRLAFTGSKTEELWAMLIEKAFAKLHGGYAILEKGNLLETLSILTGAPVEYIKHDTTPQKLWDLIKRYSSLNYLICATANADNKGILKGIAYTIIGLKEVINGEEKVQLVQLHCPWGTSEWTGQWNEDDSCWTAEMRRDLNHKSKDDGMIFIPIKDFMETFNNTFVAKTKTDYAHSEYAINSLKAFVAFQVGAETKGFLSGYQIGPKLGESMVRGYSLAKFNVELYKLEEGGPKLLKGGNNNSIGEVSLEVELEPGFYVMKGDLGSSSKLPSIVFTGYTNLGINFAELKINDIKEITKESFKSAINSLNCPYISKPILKDKKYAGAFRNCLNGHRLRLSMSPTDTGDTYKCENCRQMRDIFEGRWQCKQCGYDICTVCRPRNHGNIGHKTNDKAVTVVTCSNEHLMNFLPLNDKQTIYLCDKCGKAYFGMVARWRCDQCDQDLCRECIAEPKGYKSAEEVLSIDTCPKNHPLEFLTTETTMGVYDCYICSKLGDTHNGRWSCLECGINICHVCKPCQKAKDGMLSVKTKTLVCEKGHLLLFGCPSAGDETACNKCGNPIKENWRWTCRTCSFDVCTNCRPEPEGRREALCPNMHKLVYSNLPQGNTSYGRCNVCRKVFRLANGRHCCFPCGYECCQGCLPLPGAVKPSEDEAVVERTTKKRPKPQPEPQLESKPQVQVQPKPQSQPQAQAQLQQQLQSQSKTQKEIQPERKPSGSASQKSVVQKPPLPQGIIPKEEVKKKTKEPEPVPEEPKVKSKPKPREPEPEPKPEPELVPEPKPKQEEPIVERSTQKKVVQKEPIQQEPEKQEQALQESPKPTKTEPGLREFSSPESGPVAQTEAPPRERCGCRIF